MKYFDWDEKKNEKLKKERDISFEIIVSQIEQDKIIDIIENSNYKNQKIFIIEFESYAYLVPFVEDEKKIFLKTIIPSRKATKKYLEND